MLDIDHGFRGFLSLLPSGNQAWLAGNIPELNLVGGAITILKNDGVRQWGWDDIPYMKWKIKTMFETRKSSIHM